MSDEFRFETFVDAHSNIFREYLSSLIAKLPESNEDYRAIQEQMEAIFQQYPKVLEAVDTETAAELSQQECAALDSLILMGVQYRVPTLLIDFQNLIFRCMPKKTFENMGMSKQDTIRLCHSMRSLDFSPGLDEVVCPVTIICGEKDGANIKAARQLKNLLPQAELHIIPGAGHEINKCKPEAVAAIIKSL